MMTLSLKPANAHISMAIWRTALGIVYAIIAIEVFVVAHMMVSQKILQMPSFIHHGKISALHAPKAAAKHTSGELNGLYSLAIAVLLAGYLHLKLSVDAGSRNRLTKLKGRAVQEETTFEDVQREHILLGSLLASAKIITEEQLVQALELSRRTHRLLGDTIVSLGFLQDADIETGLELQQELKARKISRENAQLALAVAVSHRVSSSEIEKLRAKQDVEAARPVKRLTGFDIPIRQFSVMQPSQAANEGDPKDPAASFSTLPDIFGKVSVYETIDGHRREVAAQPDSQRQNEPSHKAGFCVPQSIIITQDNLPALETDKHPTADDTVEDWIMNTIKEACNSWETTRTALFQHLAQTDVVAQNEIDTIPGVLSCSALVKTDVVDTLEIEKVPAVSNCTALAKTDVDAPAVEIDTVPAVSNCTALAKTDVDALAVEIDTAPAGLSCSALVDTLFDEPVSTLQSVPRETAVAANVFAMKISELRDNRKPQRKPSKKAKRTSRKRK